MKSFKELREKSVSQAQQKMMGMALAYKRGEMDDASPEVKKMADSMSMKDLEDFAKTKHKGLPKKVEEAYKTPEEAQAFEDGKKAARKGKKYSDNPHKDGALKTAWSKGHNNVRESVELDEARKDSAQDTYFNTYSAAVQYAKAQAEKQGYEVEEDDWFQQVTTGKGKPGRGKTTRHTLKLMKNGKPTRKGLAIQVYNRDTDKNTYELNYYVS
jgi:hypothetical protein